MFKNLIIRSNSNCCVKFLAANIQEYNFDLLKIGNCTTKLITYNERHFSNHQHALINSSVENIHLQTFVPVQNIFRFKSTDSTCASKEKSTETKDLKQKIIITPSVTPLTRGEKLKKAVKEYGSTVIVFHIGISLISLGTCYLLVTLGLDVTKVFTALGLEDWIGKSQIAASAGTFAVAYAIHKVFAPVRIAITLTSVPLIVRYLRKIGFLKK